MPNRSDPIRDLERENDRLRRDLERTERDRAKVERERDRPNGRETLDDESWRHDVVVDPDAEPEQMRGPRRAVSEPLGRVAPPGFREETLKPARPWRRVEIAHDNHLSVVEFVGDQAERVELPVVEGGARRAYR